MIGAHACTVHLARSAELIDVVYLLTSDDDVQEGKWTVMANATPVKTGTDLVSFDLDRLVKGRSVASESTVYTHSGIV